MLVDAAIMRILDELHARGLADDTIIVFTSDHGDLLGAHGGLLQKWHNAFDEAIRVPLLVSGPGIDPRRTGIDIATSHVDLVPDPARPGRGRRGSGGRAVARHHVETQPFAGRDLSPLLTGRVDEDALDAPVYFMTEDQISRGLRTKNRFTGEPFEPVAAAGQGRVGHRASHRRASLWKLNHYYDTLEQPGQTEATESAWELHNLSADPEERTNLAGDSETATVRAQLTTVLEQTRATARRTPQVVNPAR